MCSVAWDNLTLSKREGGLGFRDIQCFNDALLAKLSWRVLNKPNCLLARILLGKYCKSTPFLECQTANSISHGWRGVLIGKDLLKLRLGKVIGDGMNTKVWSDPWLSLKNPTTPTGPANKEDGDLLVADLIYPTSGRWNMPKINSILPDWVEERATLKQARGVPKINLSGWEQRLDPTQLNQDTTLQETLTPYTQDRFSHRILIGIATFGMSQLLIK